MLPGEFFLSSILQEINDQDGWLEISRIHYSERGNEPSYEGVYLVKKLIVASSLSEDVYMSYEFSPQKLPKGTTTVTVEHISSLVSFADLLNKGEQRIYFPWKRLGQCLSPVAEGYRLLKNSLSTDRESSIPDSTLVVNSDKNSEPAGCLTNIVFFALLLNICVFLTYNAIA